MPDYRAEARRAAQRHGLDPNIFLRQIRQESGFNPNARSPAGAIGIAQIMPATARGWGVNPRDPVAALNAAAKHMAGYVRQFGSYRNALVAYNAGPGAVGGRLPAETQNYIRVILGGRNPSTSSVGRGGGRRSSRSPSARSTTTKTVTTTIPGVDNRVARASLIQSFLDDNSTLDPLDFALQARQLQDVPARTTTRITRTGAPPSGHPRVSPQGAGSSFARSHSPLLELIHKGDRPYAVKNGKVVNPSVYSAVWNGHADHVHLAAGPKTVVELGRLAQRMGLHVGENSHFGGVHPVHAPNSYHYRDEAIDVSGDPRKMNEYARRVERMYGLGR